MKLNPDLSVPDHLEIFVIDDTGRRCFRWKGPAAARFGGNAIGGTRRTAFFPAHTRRGTRLKRSTAVRDQVSSFDKDGAKMVAGCVDTKPAVAIP